MNRFLIIIMFLLSSNVIYGNNIYFNVENLKLRKESSVKSKSIRVITKGTKFTVLGKNNKLYKYDTFNSYWYKIKYKGHIGWVYGGYVVKYNQQNISEFIRRYNFIRYFLNGRVWFSKETKYNIHSEIYLGFVGSYNEFLCNHNLNLNIVIVKKGDTIIEGSFSIKKFKKIRNGYMLFTSSNKYFAKVGIKNRQLKIYDILDLKRKNYGITASTIELKKLTFKLEPDRKYWE